MAGSEPWPSRIGRYEVILPIAIAADGTPTVYLARTHTTIAGGEAERYLALKLMAAPSGSDPTLAARIAAAKHVTPLRHTNVVQTFDAGECEHGAFLVMEYVPGDSFSGLQSLSRQAGRELPQGVALKILVDALIGLHAAHEHAAEAPRPRDLVHRRFSPQEILVGTDGIARVTDFGLAQATSTLSKSGGTRYLAPEQARGDDLDRRCDVWAGGVIAWEVLAGRSLPTDAEDDGARSDPPRLKTVASDVSDELDDVVGRALRIDRELRTSSAQLFARELVNAAKAAGLLADTDEVAEHVARLAGPELAERKALLAEARRQKRPISAPDVRTMIGLSAAPPLKRAPLASLPDVPATMDDGASELRIEVDLKKRPAERANVDVLGEATAALPLEKEPEVFQSPVASPPADDEPLAKAPSLRSPDGVQKRIRDGASLWFTPPWTPKKISAAAAIGGLIGFGIVLVAVSCGAPKATTTATLASAATQSSPSRDEPPPEPTPATTPTGASESAMDPAPVLQIKANGAIASVRVGERFVDAIVPAPTLNVDLEEDERDKMLRITVTGTDGRIAMATAEPGVTAVDVTFGEKPRPRPTVAAPATTTKHPWSKRTH